MSINKNFVVFTDDASALTKSEREKSKIRIIPSVVTIDGANVDTSCSTEEFCKLLRSAKKEVKTASASPSVFVDAFKPELSAGKDILYVGMPQQISSGTASSFNVAKNELSELFPERTIERIDSHCMSRGTAMLILEAAKTCNSMDEFKDFIVSRRDYVEHLFTMDDMSFAVKSGKISNIEGVIASALGIQALLELRYDLSCKDEDGLPVRTLHATKRIRCKIDADRLERDKVASEIILKTHNRLESPTCRIEVSYGEGVNPDEKTSSIAYLRAEYIAQQLNSLFPKAEIIFNPDCRVCNIILAHVGPGVVSVHFFGAEPDKPSF